MKKAKLLDFYSNRYAWKIYNELKVIKPDYRYNFDYVDRAFISNELKRYVNELGSNQQLLGQEFAICCDIEMDLYLVPKTWVKEVVQRNISDYLYEFAKAIL